MVSSVRIRD